MTYYAVRSSLDNKIVGKYTQVEEAIYSCDVWEDPRFIDHENVSFKRNDFEPITAKAMLVKKAKPTDLISAGIMGFSKKLLVSGKLKKILLQARTESLQFYNSPVIYKGIELHDYWVINPYIFNPEFVDFSETEIYLQRNYSKKVELLPVSTYHDFELEKKRVEGMGYPYSIFIEKPKIKEDMTTNFFVIENVDGGIMYIVSEHLKGIMEDNDITGIEFMPTTLSFHEWTAQGGPREKIYGKIN